MIQFYLARPPTAHGTPALLAMPMAIINIFKLEVCGLIYVGTREAPFDALNATTFTLPPRTDVDSKLSQIDAGFCKAVVSEDGASLARLIIPLRPAPSFLPSVLTSFARRERRPRRFGTRSSESAAPHTVLHSPTTAK